MADGADVSGSTQQQEASKWTRQEGDGYESNGATKPQPLQLPNSTTGTTGTAITNNGELQKTVASPAVKENNTEGNKENIAGSAGASKHHSSNARAAGLSSPKDLRQQFRQLQSQELIRRILQSTVIVPKHQPKQQNNLQGNDQNLENLKGNSLGKSQQKQNNLHQELPKSESEDANVAESNLNEGSKSTAQTVTEPKVEGAIPVTSVADKAPQKSADVKVDTDVVALPDLAVMQAPNAFVCSQCCTDTSLVQTEKHNHHGHHEPKEVESFQSTQDGSVISLSLPNSEEEQDKADTAAQGATRDRGVGDSYIAKPDVLKLSERLQQQPSHETLDEILKLLQSQAIPPHRQASAPTAAAPTKPAIQQTNVSEPGLVMEASADAAWKQQQHQLSMISAQPNLREKHSRQLADMKDYYECEMLRLREQLEILRSNLAALQEAVPVKMLEATNHRLEARCHLMEEIASDLKGKYNRLDHGNQELEATCHELRQANEALEMRCLLLQKSNQELDERHTEVLNNRKILESKILHLTQANDQAQRSCHQLEDANKNFERTCRELEEAKNKMEARYRKSKEENLKISGDVRDLQVSLLSANKHSQELEESIESLQNEKRDWGLKLDASHKMSTAAQTRYADFKAEAEKKDAMYRKMDEQMAMLSTSLENTSKTKEELEKNAERDKELLKRLLIEYDALAKEHQHSKADVESWSDKVNTSQDEVNSLRGTISKLIRRNTTLEDSLREALTQQIGSRSKPESTPSSSVRKTWDSPVSLRTERADARGNGSLLSEYDLPSRGPRTSSTPFKSDHAHSDDGVLTDVSRVLHSTGKTSGTTGIKFEIPWESTYKSPSPTKATIKRNLEKSYSPEKPSAKSPGNLVLKKSDLVTRFDVVFEDSKSGEEVKRSHTGRTSRAQGESPTSIFVSNSGTNVAETSPSDRLVTDAAEAALNAMRTGRVTSHGESWDYRETATARKRRERSRERRTGKTMVDESKDKQDDGVWKLERKFSTLTEERKRLESTLSRIPNHRTTKRSKEDKAFLDNRLDDVVKEIGSVRMQLRRHHAL